MASCGDRDEPFRYEGAGGVPVSVTFTSDVPVAQVTVDEDTPRGFLLDTGSPVTVLDPDVYPLPEGRLRPARLSMLGITALSPLVGVLDLFDDELSVAGVLGGDLLRHFALTVDYRAASVVLYPALHGGVPPCGDDLDPAVQTGFTLRGGGVLSLTSDEDLPVPATRIVVTLLLEGREIDAVLDTGATSVVLRESLYDALATERPERPSLQGLEVITVDGALATELSRAADLALADAPEASRRTSVETMVVQGSVALDGVSAEVGRPVDALLGAAYLRWFQLTVDYPARRLTLRPYRTPDHVDPDAWITVGFNWYETDSGAVWVDRVVPGTAAETAGLRAGDRILRAGDRDITQEGRFGVEAAVDASALGDEVPFTLERGGASYQVDVEIEDLLPAFE